MRLIPSFLAQKAENTDFVIKTHHRRPLHTTATILTKPLPEIPDTFCYQIQIPSPSSQSPLVWDHGVASKSQIQLFCQQKTQRPQPLTHPLLPTAQLCFLSPKDIHAYLHDGPTAPISWDRSPFCTTPTAPYWVISNANQNLVLDLKNTLLPFPIEIGYAPHEISSLDYNFATLVPHLETGQKLGKIILHQELFDDSPLTTSLHAEGPVQTLRLTFLPTPQDMQRLTQLLMSRISRNKPIGDIEDLLLQADPLTLQSHLLDVGPATPLK